MNKARTIIAYVTAGYNNVWLLHQQTILYNIITKAKFNNAVSQLQEISATTLAYTNRL